jgi:hypothetical protein
MHLSVNAVPVSLVTVLELVKLHDGSGYAVWKKAANRYSHRAHTMIGAPITTNLPYDLLGSFVPIEFR